MADGDGVVVLRLFSEPPCTGAHADSFHSLLVRTVRKLIGADKGAPVGVEYFHGAPDIDEVAGEQIIEVGFPSNPVATELLKINPNAKIVRLRLLPSDEEGDSPFVAFYEKASLELAGKPAQYLEWNEVHLKTPPA